jgi:hypothetical protein
MMWSWNLAFLKTSGVIPGNQIFFGKAQVKGL